MTTDTLRTAIAETQPEIVPGPMPGTASHTTIGALLGITPTADLPFLDFCTGYAEEQFAFYGTITPTGLVDSDCIIDGRRARSVVLTNGIDDANDLDRLLTSMHHAGFELDSPRSAILTIAHSIVDPSPEAKALLADLTAEGQALNRHPDAIETVVIAVESDLGHTVQLLQVNRPHPAMVMLERWGAPMFTPAHSDCGNGIFSGHHIPTAARDDIAMRSYRKRLALTYGQMEDAEVIDDTTDLIALH